MNDTYTIARNMHYSILIRNIDGEFAEPSLIKINPELSKYILVYYV